MKTNNETPLPWYTRPTGGGSQSMIASETDGKTVAVIYTNPDDAALIVRAVNAHADLVAALERWTEYAVNRDVPFPVIAETRAAIAKAKGGAL